MYQSCIFDLYGTLVDIRTDEGTDEFWDKVAEIYKSNGAQYESEELRALYLHYAKLQDKLPRILHPFCRDIEIDLKRVFDKLYRVKGVKADDKIIAETALQFRKASTQFIRLYDGVLDLLDSLKNAGKKIYLLSNAQSCFTIPELEMLGIINYFDGILISSDCGCKKPGKRFFDILLRRYKIDKSTAIMIGNDCYSDMLGAENAGLASLYIHQEISTPLEGNKLVCNYSVMDGDVSKMKQYLIK